MRDDSDQQNKEMTNDVRDTAPPYNQNTDVSDQLSRRSMIQSFSFQEEHEETANIRGCDPCSLRHSPWVTMI